MPVLKVSNGYAHSLPGLGRLRAFGTLSEKQITKCARDSLGWKYGRTLVKVSSSATFDGSEAMRYLGRFPEAREQLNLILQDSPNWTAGLVDRGITRSTHPSLVRASLKSADG